MSDFYRGATLHLSISGVESDIFWAFNLGDADIVLKRTDNHGFTERFPDGDITLEFLSGFTESGLFESAFPLIEDAVSTSGENADIRFIIKKEGVEVINLLWDINKYSSGDNFNKLAKLSFKEESWDDEFNKAKKTKTNLFDNEDVNGDPVERLKADEILTHSKVLRKTYDVEVDPENNIIEYGATEDAAHKSGGTSTPGGTGVYIKHGFTKSNNLEYENNFTYSPQRKTIRPDDSVSNLASTALEPTQTIGTQAAPATREVRPIENDKLFDLKIPNDSNYTFEINADFALNINLIRITDVANAKLKNLYIIHFLRIYDKDGDIKVNETLQSLFQENLDTSIRTPSTPGVPIITVNTQVNSTLNYNLKKEDTVYFYSYVNIDHSSLTANIYFDFNYSAGTYKIIGDTTIADTYIKGYKRKEFLEKLIELTTGNKNALRTSILDNSHYMNGTLIREGSEDRTLISEVTSETSPSTTISDLLESEDMMENIGYGTELDGTQNVLRVEKADYFYQDSEIIDLTGNSFESSIRSFATDRMWNRAVLKYPDFRDDEINTLDEFNTETEYLLNNRNLDRLYSKTSKFKTSMYDIENLRRQGQQSDTTALMEDNDIYKMSTIEVSDTLTSTISITNNRILLNPGLSEIVLKGNQFTITGSASNDGIYTYELSTVLNAGGGSFSIEVNEGFNSDVTNESVTITTRYYKAKSNEGYNLVDGIISPQTAYNVDYALHFAYQNHANILNASQYNSPNSSIVRNREYKRNGLLRTQLLPADPILTASQDFTIGESNNGNKLHNIYIYNQKMGLSEDQLTTIKSACKGQGANKYGYITHDTNYGIKQSFLLSLRGNRELQIYELKLLQK